MFGSPETTTGGKALKFYTSIWLDIRRIAAIKNGTDVVGNRTKVKVVKNKLAPPFKECEFDIMYGEGISKYGDLLDLASDMNIVQKSGTWYSHGEDRLGQGRENVKVYLKENQDFAEKIELAVRKKLNLIQEEEMAEVTAETNNKPAKEKK